MSNKIFPASLHGLSWELKRSPRFLTQSQPGSAVGVESRASYGPDPVYDFELNYTILHAGSWSLGTRLGKSGNNELSQIEAFFLQQRGSFDSFLVDAGAITKNTSESSVSGQPLTIDANGCAPLVRTKPQTTYNEAIYELAVDGSGNVIYPVLHYGGGTLLRGRDYEVHLWPEVSTGVLNAGGIAYGGVVIRFIASPEITSGVTADFSWMYRVKFDEDMIEFEMFHYLLWKLQGLKLKGVRF